MTFTRLAQATAGPLLQGPALPALAAIPRRDPPPRASADLLEFESARAPHLGYHFGKLPLRPPSPAPSPALLQRKCAPCAKEEDEERNSPAPPLQRSAARSASAPRLAPIVTDVLATPGRPLESGVRARMENAFGYDFSAIRVHDDARADKAARAVDAHAYTSGAHIVFAAGRYNPSNRSGQRLIAHELAHTLQQQHSAGVARQAAIGPARGPLESEADAAADAALEGRRAKVQGRVGPTLQRFGPCRYILDATEREQVAESDVQAHLALPIRALGPTEREFPIPEGSFSPYRDEDRRTGTARSQYIGGRAGTGAADIALMQGSVMELLEIKRGEWSLAADAERQVHNYVDKGRRDMGFLTNRWHQRGHAAVTVTNVRPMPRNRLRINSPARIGSIPVSMAFCTDGVVAFKAIGNQDPDIYVCSPNLEGANSFINNLLGRAEAAVDNHLDNVVNPRLDRAIQNMPIRRAILLVLRSPEARGLLEQALGPGGGTLLDTLPLETIAAQIEERLQGELDRFIRILVQNVKDRVLVELRRRMKQGLRQWLQTILLALCAAAAARATITADELLRELGRQMGRRMAELLPEAITVVALAMARELLAAIGRALLEVIRALAILVGIVVAAILLWEVAAALAAATTLAEAGAAILALLGQLVRLIPAFA